MAIEQITDAIGALKHLAGEGQPTPSISFVLGQREDTRVWDAILGMGGVPEKTLYEYDEKEPSVIESMAVHLDGVEVRVQRDRAPTIEELGNKRGTYRHETAFVASDV